MTTGISDRYLNRYRIPSNRRRGWNYAQNAHYFITIVTNGRKQIFGKITEGQMVLNKIGEIVNAEFLKSFEMRKELYMGEYVIMPNHIHAILILDNDENVRANANTTEHGVAKREPKSISSFVAGFKSSSINRIDDWIDNVNGQNVNNETVGCGNVGCNTVGCTAVETHGRASLQSNAYQKFNKNNPLWQSNYHDHIIRNEMEYRRIAEYIVNNPLKWNEDILSNIEKTMEN